MASASRDFVRQTCAQPKKTRCRPVSPSMTGASSAAQRQLVGQQRDRQAAEVADVLADRERAVDVLAVGQLRGGVYASYCSINAFVREPNSARSSSVHQSTRLPSPSYLAPWSSKPWPISWPITAPMPP